MKDKRDTREVNLFLEEIKKRPALYDESNLQYKDYEMKLVLWSEIADIVCKNNDMKTVTQLKSKWKNLRDSFLKSHRLYTEKISKGISAKPPTHSIMKFILPHAKPKRSKYDSESDNDSSNNDQEMETMDSIRDENADAGYEYGADAGGEVDADDLPIAKLAEEKYADEYDNNDETEIFFRSIAKTVKRLAPANQALVKKAIANIVLDVEYREARDLEHHK